MQKFSEDQFRECLKKGELVDCAIIEESFEVRIREYVPYICTAIHAGHAFRPSLEGLCLLSEEERFLEEDPFTDQLIHPFPITIVGLDSRYEYDLNRHPDVCIYENAWGQKVWKEELSSTEKGKSLSKHALYYRLLKMVVETLKEHFGECLIFDLHSYNWQVRQYKEAPVFNVGTAQLDMRRWNRLISFAEKQLSEVKLSNVEVTVGRNVVFQGRGYQTTFAVNELDVPIVPLEVKKVFMDEKTGAPFPVVIEELQKELYPAIFNTAAYFVKGIKRRNINRSHLISNVIDPVAQKVDQALYRLAKTIETLPYVNPINIQQERKKFLSKQHYEPQFRYKPLRIDPYQFREKLYTLPVSKIQDPLLKQLYRAVVDGLAKKIDLLTSIGTEQFRYNSLRHFGEPTKKDSDNARYLLHCNDLDEHLNELPEVDADGAREIFLKTLEDHQIDFKVSVTTSIVAKAMVNNAKSTLQINKNARFTETELNALISHEFGVHVLTTINGRNQPLHLLSLGLPGNTYTQEGLAILSEYLSGNLTINRLKILALRVYAVNMMLEGKSFYAVYSRLREEYGQSVESAFDLTVRVFRGGGYTKDYLYLSGFREMVGLYKKQSLDSLFAGKTSSFYLPVLDELIERGTLKKPLHLPESFRNPKTQNPILTYLIDSIH